MADSEKRGRVCERHGVWCPDGECADCNALARDVAVGALAYAEALNAREASDADIANAALLKIGSPQLGDGELLTLLDVARRCEANNIASSAVWLHLLEKTNPFLVDLPYDPTKTPAGK